MIEPCKCACHASGYATYKAVCPPIPCCQCSPFWSKTEPLLPGFPQLNPSDSMLDLKQQIRDLQASQRNIIAMTADMVKDVRDQNHVLSKRVEALESRIGSLANFKLYNEQIKRLEQSRDSNSRNNKQSFERIDSLDFKYDAIRNKVTDNYIALHMRIDALAAKAVCGCPPEK